MSTVSRPITQRKNQIEALLRRHEALWRPQPFKVPEPAWLVRHPELAERLLALDDTQVEALSGDNDGLIALLAEHIPELGQLKALADFPEAAATPPIDAPSHLFRDIPGRKQAQIEAYAAAVGEPKAPILEWCAGKGHLGRLLAHAWHRPVTSLEIDATLCADGAALARRARLDPMQRFIAADALSPDTAALPTGHHAVALHACGDLHRDLLRKAVAAHAPALHLAPCCYYKMAAEHYQPFSGDGPRLDRDDLRLAVTETVTAAPREQRRSRRAMAWKLGWVALRQSLTGETAYRPFPPTPEAWLRGDFSDFARHMAARAGLPLPAGIDLAAFEEAGLRAARRVRRLELARLAFRRPLEAWLLLDMACHLETHGYRVEITQFCPRRLTPRNLLLAACRA